MKTLIILSHPDVSGSSTQQFLMAATQTLENVTLHHLEKYYPQGNINREYEQTLIADHDRIIFQFPLYWYSSPATLKEWQDVVLDEKKIDDWQGKEFGIVVIAGVAKKEYQAGGREIFTMDELMRPYQAVANKFKWQYLPIFGIYQFAYMTESCKQKLLIRYQQYIMLGNSQSLADRMAWFQHQLTEVSRTKEASVQHKIDLIKEQLQANQEELEMLRFTLDELE
ncbi:NAD(P)H-dependent oxidoreductase [Vagococcus zengguangii]|uniref:NAD(P)H-dependent oxidoreductase n=1 Tax=Vagococcus zengguangii TaxID=2571750 RepID=A0A4D7CSC5_9ENTE|nr:NAD(P)H-dependent oxidoreductase [Vagococcus zengguangii]QCI85784.1 NAD(P)H-dependent oxidoreductase [Vagococcus zengguangii]TLG81724.1 NAD(P)H-dependent oxidoreductase [Vagococcus zengguangii]